MPAYELTLIVRPLAKSETVQAVKQACMTLLDRGAVIRKIESLGCRDLPFKMKVNDVGDHPKEFAGSYFLLYCNLPTSTSVEALKEYKQNKNLLKSYFEKEPQHRPLPPCTMWEELRTPAERLSVRELRQSQKLGKVAWQLLTRRTLDAMRWKPKAFGMRKPKG